MKKKNEDVYYIFDEINCKSSKQYIKRNQNQNYSNEHSKSYTIIFFEDWLSLKEHQQKNALNQEIDFNPNDCFALDHHQCLDVVITLDQVLLFTENSSCLSSNYYCKRKNSLSTHRSSFWNIRYHSSSR